MGKREDVLKVPSRMKNNLFSSNRLQIAGWDQEGRTDFSRAELIPSGLGLVS